MDNYTELRKAIEAATPGPWVSDNSAIPWTPKQKSPFDDHGASVLKENEDVHDPIVQGGAQDEQGGAVGVLRNEDATYIATANPAVIKQLLADYDRVKAENERLREALKPFAKEAARIPAAWSNEQRYEPNIVSKTHYMADFTVGDLRRARAEIGEG